MLVVPLLLLRSVCAKVKTRKQKVTQYHLSLGLVKSFIENEVSVIESVNKSVNKCLDFASLELKGKNLYFKNIRISEMIDSGKF